METLKYFLIGSGIAMWVIISLFTTLYLWPLIVKLFDILIDPFFLLVWLWMPIDELKERYENRMLAEDVVKRFKSTWKYDFAVWVCRKRLKIKTEKI